MLVALDNLSFSCEVHRTLHGATTSDNENNQVNGEVGAGQEKCSATSDKSARTKGGNCTFVHGFHRSVPFISFKLTEWRLAHELA